MKRYIFALLLIIILIAAGCRKADNERTADPTETPVPTPTPKSEYMLKLEEEYKDYVETEYGLDITLKEDIVSICYSTWFNPVVDKKKPVIYNIQDILDRQAAGENVKWGPLHSFHYWSKPALGYYRSDDKEVIRTHMTQLNEAGVDFIIIDNTNAQATVWQAGKKNTYWDQMVTQSCTALLDTITEMRAEGLKTPYVVFWNRVDEAYGWVTPTQVYDEFYTNEKYKDVWVYWEGKPFMLVNILASAPGQKYDVGKFKYKDDLTLRQMTVAIIKSGLSKQEWSFLYDGALPCKDQFGFYEHISVYVARQTTYMSKTNTAIGRNGGKTFYEQWKRAFEHHPKVVTLTWWNEWIAQRFEVDTDNDGKMENHFTDNYNIEYSRDIEPMEGGHGDKYYLWMKEYIKAYKARQECPGLFDEN